MTYNVPSGTLNLTHSLTHCCALYSDAAHYLNIALYCMLHLRITAGLPGPVLFGFAMDQSCLLWEEKCDGSTGACLYYDNHQVAWLLMAVCVVCKLLNIVCGLLSWRLYLRKTAKDDLSAQTGLEQETENDPTGKDVRSNTDEPTGVSNPAVEWETIDL